MPNANIGKQDFNSIRPGEDEGSYNMEILEHKTTSTKGHAILYMNPRLHKEVIEYISDIRLLSKPHGELLFVSYSRKDLPANYMSKYIKVYFKSIGITKHVNATSFRKMAVTEVYNWFTPALS